MGLGKIRVVSPEFGLFQLKKTSRASVFPPGGDSSPGKSPSVSRLIPTLLGSSSPCLGSRGDTRGSQPALPLPLPLKQGRLCGRGQSCHLGGNAAVGNVGIEERVTPGPAPAPFSQLLEGERAKEERGTVSRRGDGDRSIPRQSRGWHMAPDPGIGSCASPSPQAARGALRPLRLPPPGWEGLTNLPPWSKSTISLWVRVSTERSGMAPGSSSSGGGVPKATRCGQGSCPERAGGGGKGAGMGQSGLGHGVLIEVRRYESIKNHFLPNSCLSGAGPCLCPCPDAARAPGSAPGNNPRADRRCGADPGAAGCSRGTGWESAPGIGVFSWSCCWSCCCRIWPRFHAGNP